eukprot:gene1525-910_t
MAKFKLITPEDLIGLLDSPIDGSRVAIVDCRDTDRSEGWIINSIHMPTHASTPQAYRDLAQALWDQRFLYVVFHCFASYTRGPTGARRFCEAQMELGLALPSVCVLCGGWEGFRMVYGASREDLICYGEAEEDQKRIQRRRKDLPAATAATCSMQRAVQPPPYPFQTDISNKNKTQNTIAAKGASTFFSLAPCGCGGGNCNTARW